MDPKNINGGKPIGTTQLQADIPTEVEAPVAAQKQETGVSSLVKSDAADPMPQVVAEKPIDPAVRLSMAEKLVDLGKRVSNRLRRSVEPSVRVAAAVLVVACAAFLSGCSNDSGPIFKPRNQPTAG